MTSTPWAMLCTHIYIYIYDGIVASARELKNQSFSCLHCPYIEDLNIWRFWPRHAVFCYKQMGMLQKSPARTRIQLAKTSRRTGNRAHKTHVFLKNGNFTTVPCWFDDWKSWKNLGRIFWLFSVIAATHAPLSAGSQHSCECISIAKL